MGTQLVHRFELVIYVYNVNRAHGLNVVFSGKDRDRSATLATVTNSTATTSPDAVDNTAASESTAARAASPGDSAAAS